jgi:hypothetical protein
MADFPADQDVDGLLQRRKGDGRLVPEPHGITAKLIKKKPLVVGKMTPTSVGGRFVTNGSHAIGSTEAIDAGLVLAKHYTSALLASMELEEYHKMATVEDEMWYYHVLRRHMWSYLKPHLRTEAVKVLDAGCGTGGLIRYLHAKEPTWHLTGVDVSPVACELARRRGCL